MTNFNDKEILAGIRNGNKQVLQYVYSECFNSIRHLVCFNRGTLDEARDVFQDALVIICERSMDEEFTLVCSFRTFLYAIARNIWFRRLSEKVHCMHHEMEIPDTRYMPSDDSIEYKATVQEERMILYQHHFEKLTESCKAIIQMMLEKASTKRIMQIMKFSSIAYTRKRKYQCKQSLINRIHADPDFLRLKENDDEQKKFQPRGPFSI